MNRIHIIQIVAAVTFFLSSSCQIARVKAPEAFAEYKDYSESFYAVSPDNVSLYVHSEDNRPAGSLKVLSSAVELHFKSIGYRVLHSESIQTNNGLEGKLFIASVQTMAGEFRYLVAFFPDGESVHIVEASGKKEDFLQYEKELIESVSTLKKGS